MGLTDDDVFILELRKEYHRHQILYRFSFIFHQCFFDSICRSQSKNTLRPPMVSLNQNKPVWIRDNEHGFVLGKVTDIGADQITVQLNENRKVKR